MQKMCCVNLGDFWKHRLNGFQAMFQSTPTEIHKASGKPNKKAPERTFRHAIRAKLEFRILE